jgi:hypothetical protein
MCLIRGSAKWVDVRRDARVLVHSPMLNADDPKLRGRLAAVVDEAVQAAAALWEPPPEFDVFQLDVESAALFEWSKGRMSVHHWP